MEEPNRPHRAPEHPCLGLSLGPNSLLLPLWLVSSYKCHWLAWRLGCSARCNHSLPAEAQSTLDPKEHLTTAITIAHATPTSQGLESPLIFPVHCYKNQQLRKSPRGLTIGLPRSKTVFAIPECKNKHG